MFDAEDDEDEDCDDVECLLDTVSTLVECWLLCELVECFWLPGANALDIVGDVDDVVLQDDPWELPAEETAFDFGIVLSLSPMNVISLNDRI